MLMLKDGKVMMKRDGTMAPIREELSLTDGTTRMMQDGEIPGPIRTLKDPEDMSERQFKEEMEDEEFRDDIR